MNEEEVLRVAQIILAVIQNPDGIETIDWQIARVIVADRTALEASWRKELALERDNHLNTIRLKDEYKRQIA